jgi:Domain of unknown function (DUF305)
LNASPFSVPVELVCDRYPARCSYDETDNFQGVFERMMRKYVVRTIRISVEGINMENFRRWRLDWVPLGLLTAVLIMLPARVFAQQPVAPDPMEKPFLAENDQAMKKMMDGMAAKPSGDIDSDFVAMMQPHHQGAIDMAEAELRYGHNEQLRRIAQEIIVDQQQEIVAMSVALKRPLPPSAPVPTQTPQAVSHQTQPQTMNPGMSMPMPTPGNRQ